MAPIPRGIGQVKEESYIDRFGKIWTFIVSLKDRNVVATYGKNNQFTKGYAQEKTNRSHLKIHHRCSVDYNYKHLRYPVLMLAIEMQNGTFNLYNREEHRHSKNDPQPKTSKLADKSKTDESDS